MNSIAKAAIRLGQLASTQSVKNVIGKREFTRTLWLLSTKNPDATITSSRVLDVHKPSMNCSCGCAGVKHVHSKVERELVEFLAEEIVAERKAQKIKTVPSTLGGFTVKLDGADVELTKQTDKEKIIISFNVNHTVDAEEEPEIDSRADKPELGEMRSKPRFEIDFVKGSTTLSFTCSYLDGTAQEGEYNDVFGIDEMTLYEGEWNDKVYAVAGEVLDGYLYDLLMNFLEEKGISSDFVEKISDLATAYEHTSYIAMLEGLSKFTTAK